MASKAAAVAVVSHRRTVRKVDTSDCFSGLGFLPHLLLAGSWKGFVPASSSTDAYIQKHSSSVETIASLQAFRKRHSEAQRLSAAYASQPTTVDFARYRSILKNQAIVDEAEKTLKEFKPVTYDVNAHVKAIETFEATAVSFAVSLKWSISKAEFFICYRSPRLRRLSRRLTSSSRSCRQLSPTSRPPAPSSSSLYA